MDINCSIGTNIRRAAVKRYTVTTAGLYAALSRPVKGPKDGKFICLGHYANDRRNSGDFLGTNVIVLSDLSRPKGGEEVEGNMPPKAAHQILCGIQHFIVTGYHHTPKDNRWLAFIMLAQELKMNWELRETLSYLTRELHEFGHWLKGSDDNTSMARFYQYVEHPEYFEHYADLDSPPLDVTPMIASAPAKFEHYYTQKERKIRETW